MLPSVLPLRLFFIPRPQLFLFLVSLFQPKENTKIPVLPSVLGPTTVFSRVQVWRTHEYSVRIDGQGVHSGEVGTAHGTGGLPSGRNDGVRVGGRSVHSAVDDTGGTSYPRVDVEHDSDRLVLRR